MTTELFYFDLGFVSVHARHEDTSASAGARMEGDDMELWVGKFYAIASFNARKGRFLTFAATALGASFGIGWLFDPPYMMIAANTCATGAVRFAGLLNSLVQ